MTDALPFAAENAAPLDVVYSDHRLAVVNKPPGLMVHDSALARGETDFVVDRLRQQFGRPVFLLHRLDRATSGCLMLAFDRETASAMGRQLMAQQIRKDYLAVCRGWPEAAGLIDHPLDGGPGKPQKKPAQTRYQRLCTGELDEPSGGFPSSRFALLQCAPQTGRFRQIRRHLKHLHHHLLGDTSHGDGQRNRMFRMRGVHRMLLHAWQLSWTDLDGLEMTVQAGWDGEFQRALDLFGWRVGAPLGWARSAGTDAAAGEG